MNVSIVSIGDSCLSEWIVKAKEGVTKRGSTYETYYLESSDPSILQKIRIGSTKSQKDKEYRLEKEQQPEGKRVIMGIHKNIMVQTLELPFTEVRVNPLNLNPYIGNYDKSSDKSDKMVILLIGNKDYRYIRSKCTNDEKISIISTFRTEDVIGCVLRVSEDFTGEDIFTINVVKDEKFEFIKLGINKETSEVEVADSIIKNPAIIKNLEAIDKRFERDNVSRRLLRTSKQMICTNFISPLPFEEVKEVILKYEFDDAIDFDMFPANIFTITVDEKGLIVNDDKLKEIVKKLKQDKVKSLCLVNCKLDKTTFKDVRPLYLFTIDKTDVVSKKDYFIRCMKSN